MAQVFDAILHFFTEDEWPFSQESEEPILRTAYQGENGKWTCYAKARESATQFVFYSICPLNAPLEKRLLLSEFLTLANYGLIIGNFEMDLSDGEIHYKTSADFEEFPLEHPEAKNWSFTLIKQLVYANVLTMDKYLPGIMKVIYGDVAPTDAIAQIENAPVDVD